MVKINIKSRKENNELFTYSELLITRWNELKQTVKQ